MSAVPHYPLLVVDAGNSGVKCAVVKRPGGKPRVLATVATPKFSAASLRRLAREAGASAVAAASVVPALAPILRKAAPELFLIDHHTPWPFPSHVDRRTLGADRLANMAEAARRFGSGVVVADFGTAATFDVLDHRGRFAGGAIAPGLRTMAESLARRTAQLPVAALTAPPRRPGRTTQEALRCGVAGGYAGLVDALLQRLAPRGAKIVFTGGDAALVARLTGRRPLVDPLWTLRGIEALAAAANSTCRPGRRG